MYKPQDTIAVGTEDPNWCPTMSSGMMAIHMQTDTLLRGNFLYLAVHTLQFQDE